jgi:hypothetical protein
MRVPGKTRCSLGSPGGLRPAMSDPRWRWAGALRNRQNCRADVRIGQSRHRNPPCDVSRRAVIPVPRRDSFSRKKKHCNSTSGRIIHSPSGLGRYLRPPVPVADQIRMTALDRHVFLTDHRRGRGAPAFAVDRHDAGLWIATLEQGSHARTVRRSIACCVMLFPTSSAKRRRPISAPCVRARAACRSAGANRLRAAW